jgi:5-methyltetrahydrofolate corrinoid/iron sulfur protein methyltransferase
VNIVKIIGEKINGTRKLVGKAITDRDADFIQNLARKQVEGGAQYLDINAGTRPDLESDDLTWLVKSVQEVVDVPLCLDSANPRALRAAIKEISQTPMINSISGEPARLEGILPIAAEFKCPVITLCMDDRGIPATPEGRLEVLHTVVAETRKVGIPDENLYIDPLVMTIATNTNAGNIFVTTIHGIRKHYPQAHVACGLSNISFGLPARSLINRTFLVLAISAGLEAAIIDPNDRELQAALCAAELLLGHDKHCLNYTRAYRAGKLEALPDRPLAVVSAKMNKTNL